MAIILVVGNVGSGKTASMVYQMLAKRRPVYTNIRVTGAEHIKTISPDMIIKKEIVGYNKKKEALYKQSLNYEFWQKTEKPCDVVLDEIHTVFSSRRSMSHTNRIFSEWLALIRRVLGSTGGIDGDAYFITQLAYRADVILRDMAHRVHYHICHFTRACDECGMSWKHNSEQPEHVYECPECGSLKLTDKNHIIEVYKFASVMACDRWVYTRDRNLYYSRSLLHNIGAVFDRYDTRQWENLFEGY